MMTSLDGGMAVGVGIAIRVVVPAQIIYPPYMRDEQHNNYTVPGKAGIPLVSDGLEVAVPVVWEGLGITEVAVESGVEVCKTINVVVGCSADKVVAEVGVGVGVSDGELLVGRTEHIVNTMNASLFCDFATYWN